MVRDTESLDQAPSVNQSPASRIRHYVTFSDAEVLFGRDGATIWATLANGAKVGSVWGDYWIAPIRVDWTNWRPIGDILDHKYPIQDHSEE